MIQIRKVQPDDIELLRQNAGRLSFNKTAMYDRLENFMIVVSGGDICGVGYGANIEDKCLLNWIYIAEDYRRDKMGTALVKAILNNAEQNGAKTAYMSGVCDQFAYYLSFEKVKELQEISELESLYKDEFSEDRPHSFYKVSLIDYFKPCCGK